MKATLRIPKNRENCIKGHLQDTFIDIVELCRTVDPGLAEGRLSCPETVQVLKVIAASVYGTPEYHFPDIWDSQIVERIMVTPWDVPYVNTYWAYASALEFVRTAYTFDIPIDFK